MMTTPLEKILSAPTPVHPVVDEFEEGALQHPARPTHPLPEHHLYRTSRGSAKEAPGGYIGEKLGQLASACVYLFKRLTARAPQLATGAPSSEGPILSTTPVLLRGPPHSPPTLHPVEVSPLEDRTSASEAAARINPSLAARFLGEEERKEAELQRRSREGPHSPSRAPLAAQLGHTLRTMVEKVGQDAEAARPQLEALEEEEELLLPLAGNTTHDLAPAGEGVHGVVAHPGPPKPSPAAQAANFVQSTVGHVIQEAEAIGAAVAGKG